jgi:hypothetical protein
MNTMNTTNTARKYTTINVPNNKLSELYSLARGCYQRALLEGREAWSGATLAGKAKSYWGHYERSRNNLVKRIQRAGFSAEFCLVGHGRRIHLVISAPGVERVLPELTPLAAGEPTLV